MDSLIEFFTGSTSVKRKSPAKKRSAVKRKSPAKKRSAVKRKSPAKKRSAVKRKSPAKKRSQRGGVNNRKSNDWEIHSNWLKDKKRMQPVAVFKMDEEINERECAKKIENQNQLKRSKKNNRSPVWIQRVNTENGSIYYVVFIAITHGDGINNFMKEINFNYTCFKDSTNIIKQKPNLRSEITTLTQPTRAKKNYTKRLQEIFNDFDKIKIKL